MPADNGTPDNVCVNAGYAFDPSVYATAGEEAKWNQLIGVSGSSSATFQYDGMGRRIAKSIGGTSTGFLLDGPNAIQENSGAANILTGGLDEFFQRNDVSGSVVPLTDALGSVLALVDSNGVTQTQYSYDPFGNTVTNGDAGTNTSQYTGRENDGTGLYYSRARYYNPRLQRFISEDPIGLAGGINLYAYVGNNPVMFTDPTGLDKNSEGPGGGLGGGPGDGPDGGPGGGPGGGSAESGTQSCANGAGSGGVGLGGGYNLDVGVGRIGASSTAGIGAGAFHNQSGGVASGYSAGAFASGGATAFAGSHVVGAPAQAINTVFAFGAYAGAGANVFATNAASVQQLSGPFTTVSVNVGYEVANIGFQVSFGGGIWSASITPPIASVGFGAAASVITTNTVTTRTGCH